MSKGNSCKLLFQDGKGLDPYSGKEHRGNNRLEEPLSEESQKVINVIRRIVKCKSQCVIPENARPHVSHMFGALSSYGDGNIPKGIDKAYEVLSEAEKEQKAKREMKKTILNTFWRIATTALLGLIAGGIIYYFLNIKGG